MLNYRLNILLSIVLAGFILTALRSYGQISHPLPPQHPNPVVPAASNKPYSSPLGGTANDVFRQNQNAANQRMGYEPPVVPPSNPVLTHQFIFQQAQKTSREQQQLPEVQKLLKKDIPVYPVNAERLNTTRNYHQAYQALVDMQNGIQPFSLKQAVFLIENAWHDNSLNYEEYITNIEQKTAALTVLMKTEGIEPSNQLGKNYLIQKLLTERVTEYRNNTAYRVHQPFVYDFDDYMGEKDWSKMFVTKLLKTGKGQCHSLPLLYLILAEETETQAWLSLAPEHSFIMFSDQQNRSFYNYETTSGQIVSENWLMESGYINTTAIQNRIYLDTLSRKDLMATLLADLIMGYTNKFSYDNFVISMVENLLAFSPNSLQGQMFKAEILAIKTKMSLQKAGNPPVEQLSNYPEAQASYTALLRHYDYIDQLGYVEMPKEMYEQWLASLETEIRKREQQSLKNQLIKDAKTLR